MGEDRRGARYQARSWRYATGVVFSDTVGGEGTLRNSECCGLEGILILIPAILIPARLTGEQ